MFITYKCFDKNKINYLSVSDSYNKYNDYIYEYLKSNNRLSSFNTDFINDGIDDIYRDIVNNRTIRINNNDLYLKKLLRESDLVVIDIGMYELKNCYDKYYMTKNKECFSKMYSDYELLVNEITKYAKGTIVFMGLYNPTNYYDSSTDSFFYDIDIKLGELMINNGVNYINRYELIKNKQNIHYQLASIIEFYMK